MTDSIGDVSEDGYWVLTEDGWQATEKQNLALSEGAIPHDDSPAVETSGHVPQMVTISGGGSKAIILEKTDNPVYSIFVIGVVSFALLLQIFGMYMDSWTGTEYDPSEDVEWLEYAEAGIGLTESYFDCSDVTGIDDETGEKNKDMCKFAAGMMTGEISMGEILTATSIPELTDELPDQMSGELSVMCDILKDLESEAEDITSCEERESAGSTAMALFWASFLLGLSSIVFGVLGIFDKLENSNIYQKFIMTASAALSLLAMIVWLAIAPVFGEGGVPFGAGYYLTLLSILLSISITVIVWIKSSNPKEIFVL